MINLYSDTQTLPSVGMRKAIESAEVGDEHSRSDPTTLSLEKKVAELLGKEEAVFLPSGTMCNLVGVAINTSPGDVVILENSGHILRSETGGPAIVSNVLTDPIEGQRGQFTVSQIKEKLDQTSRYRPPTTLICLEQTHNFAGGTVWPLELWNDVCSFAKSERYFPKISKSICGHLSEYVKNMKSSSSYNDPNVSVVVLGKKKDFLTKTNL